MQGIETEDLVGAATYLEGGLGVEAVSGHSRSPGWLGDPYSMPLVAAACGPRARSPTLALATSSRQLRRLGDAAGVILLRRILAAAILALLGAVAAAGAYTEATRVPDQP